MSTCYYCGNDISRPDLLHLAACPYSEMRRHEWPKLLPGKDAPKPPSNATMTPIFYGPCSSLKCERQQLITPGAWCGVCGARRPHT